MGRIAESLADIIIITTQDLITEKPEQIINDILNGITKENISLAIEPDRRKAIFLGINIAKPEDIVLITGRGNDLLDINQQKIDAFYDKDIALMALKNYQKK